MPNYGDTYTKINGLYKRDKKGIILRGEFARPEFEFLAKTHWNWTEKIDGTNIRIHWDGHEVSVNGKTDNAQLHADLLKHIWDLVGKYPTDYWKTRFNELSDNADVTLYGEGYGAGIQKGGGSYSKNKKFILFDIKVGNYWLEREQIENIASSFDLPIVPQLDWGWSIYQIVDAMDLVGYSVAHGDDVPDRANFVSNPFGKIISSRSQISESDEPPIVEGYIGTPKIQLFNRFGERVIVKIKVKDYVDYHNNK